MADSFREALREIDQSTDYSGMRKAFDVVAPSIAPTVGAMALTPALGPWAGPVVGGVAGEAINNVIGLTKPSLGGYAVQALVPPAMRGAGNLKRLAPKFGTEAKSAETLNQIGIQDLRALQREYQPLTPSEELFKRVGNELIPMPFAKQSAESILNRIAMQLPSNRALYKKSRDSSQDVVDLFEPPGQGGLPATQFQEAIRTAGERVGAARRGEEGVGGTANVRNYSELFGGYARDLDASPLLRRARESFKREAVLQDVGDLGRPFVKKGVGETEQVNVNQLMNRLKDETDELGRFFKQAFDDDERKAIITRLGNINALPGIGPGPGQAVGSSKVNPVIAAMLGAGSLGAAHGGAGEAMGAAAGAYALSGAGRMARDLSIAWNIPAGRALIGQLLDRSGGKITPDVWAGIQAFAASQTANLPTNARIIKEPRKPLLASAE